ncbi:MAG: FAD-binding oxidoreductase [Candidatus Eremiobacteraeota bacterium]|nr:FAD-binding oxidoreductase [Candidatus Eremiobacteraeota bacterium]
MTQKSKFSACSIKSPSIEEVRSSDSPDIIDKYLTDEAGMIKGTAQKVFFPKNEAEVSAVVRWANETGTPLTTSGGGTGLTGSRVPLGGAVISMENMDNIREVPLSDKFLVRRKSLTGEISLCVDGEKRIIITPPGILLSDLYAVLSEKNLFYPPNPTELSASVGGNIAVNTSGGRTFRNGAIREWVKRLRIILPTGELLEINRGEVFADKEGLFHIEYSDGRKADIPIPGYKMPNVKNASGYYSKPGMDLIDLFIGAEGTLGIVTEAEIEVIKWDGGIFGCIAFFPSGEKAIKFVKEARALSRDEGEILDALTLDYFDRNSLNFMRKANPDIPIEAGGAVFFEQFLPEDPDEVLMSWMELMEKFDSLDDWSAMDDKTRERLRVFRHLLPESVHELVRGRGVGKMGMDLAVPDDKLEEIMSIYHTSARQHGFDYLIFGHIGNNNLHMNFLPRNCDEVPDIKAVYMDVARKGIGMGGTISAEHGVGKKTIMENGEEFPYIYMMYGREGLESIARTKLSLDPNAILNRGNIISQEYLMTEVGG